MVLVRFILIILLKFAHPCLTAEKKLVQAEETLVKKVAKESNDIQHEEDVQMKSEEHSFRLRNYCNYCAKTSAHD